MSAVTTAPSHGRASAHVVVVTGIGGSVGRSIGRQLAQRGLEVHGTDTREVDLSGVRTWAVPPASAAGFLPELRRRVAAVGADLLIPTALAELPIVAAGRSAFGAEVDVVVAGAGPVSLTRDRLLTAFHLSSRGVAVPNFASPSTFADTKTAMASLGGPLMIRRRSSTAGRSAFRVDDSNAIDWSTLSDEHIVQRYIPGVEYLPMVYRPRGKGRGRHVSVLRSSAQANAGAVSSPDPLVVEEGAEDIERLVMAAVRALGLTGPADLIIRREGSKPPVVVDVSARFGRHWQANSPILDAVLAASRDYPSQGLTA